MKFKKQFPFVGKDFYLELFETHERNFALDRHTIEKGSLNEWVTLFNQAIEEFHRLNGESLIFRMTNGQDKDDWFKSLADLDFMLKHERVEFKSPISGLPEEVNSPLKWKSWENLEGWDLKKIAKLMYDIAHGDPDFDPNEDAEACIKGYLAETKLTSSKDCFHIGFLNEKTCAFIIAQIAPNDGWSRITYMGMLPEFRGQGLGKWIHRHGFSMMKEQGGKLYHGGTVATNSKMVKLFQDHGCQEFRRMSEWVYRGGK